MLCFNVYHIYGPMGANVHTCTTPLRSSRCAYMDDLALALLNIKAEIAVVCALLGILELCSCLAAHAQQAEVALPHEHARHDMRQAIGRRQLPGAAIKRAAQLHGLALDQKLQLGFFPR